MSCRHHHGSYCDGPPPPEWADRYRVQQSRPRWVSDEERCAEPDRWRRRRGSRAESTAPVEDIASLETRARDLRDQLEDIEAAITRLSPQSDGSGGR